MPDDETERYKCPTCGGRYDQHVKRNGVMGCCPHCGTKVRHRVIQPGQSQLEGF
jgi:DNA-directed RNA polymerase subunit RPC12/RpoP